MDKKINQIKKKSMSETKDLEKLAKMDKKRDKVCELGEKMKRKGKKD